MVTFTINIPQMLAYHTWILWVHQDHQLVRHLTTVWKIPLLPAEPLVGNLSDAMAPQRTFRYFLEAFSPSSMSSVLRSAEK